MKLPIAIITGLLLTGSVQASTAESMLPNTKAETYNLGMDVGECKVIRVVSQYLGAGPQLHKFMSIMAKGNGYPSIKAFTEHCEQVTHQHKRILSAQ